MAIDDVIKELEARIEVDLKSAESAPTIPAAYLVGATLGYEYAIQLLKRVRDDDGANN